MAANLSPVGAPSFCVTPHFAPSSSFPDDATIHILSFLENKDLRVQDSVSRVFRPFIDTVCKERCQDERFIPESLPAGVNYKQFLLNRFPNAIGPDFFEEYIGEVDTVSPVPRHFIEMASRPGFKLGFKLVFIPEYITITVDANSPLMLDETFAVDGKKARLIEDPERAPQGKRKIKIPVTPNNIILLTQKYLKKNFPSRFGGMHDFSWENVLNENGDIGVGPSHWSYQKEDVIGLGKPYHSQPGIKGQVEIATDEGLEIVPLGERILFHLSSYIKSGKIPQSANVERTSTITHSDVGTPWQSTIRWPDPDSVFCLRLDYDYDFSHVGAAARVPLRLYYDYDDCVVGAAARVPAGSSQAIGH